MRIINLHEDYPGDCLNKLLLNRGPVISEDMIQKVDYIINCVRKEGDRALLEFTKLYDGVELTKEELRVTKGEIEGAYKKIDDRFLRALRNAKDNIYAFHSKQIKSSWFDKGDGMLLGQLINPLDSVGVYIPGGTACYPSSVLMNVLPAKVAGVTRVAMITPAGAGGVSPGVLVAASEAGADEIYKVGGAQGIAALAYGTDTIPAVDKITGPGNVYVAAAKRQVFGDVGIDMVAGPSEVLIIADAKANPVFVAADMLAQAEHDAMARCILITDSEIVLQKVNAEIKRQLDDLPRKDIARRALEGYGALILVKDMEEACNISNKIAPEHVGLMVEEPLELMDKIKNAGALFLGNYSPEALGDYYAGVNHVLPTGGNARFSSPLGVEQFIKKTNILYSSPFALRQGSEDIKILAEVEGLKGHGIAVDLRQRDHH